MRARTLLIPVSIALLAGGLAIAGPGRDGHRTGRMGMRLDRMARQLDLTDAQRARIREIFEEHRDSALGDAAAKSRASRSALRTLIHDPEANEQAIRDAATRASRSDADLAVERHRALAEAFKVLTPEQQEKAKQLREQRAARRKPTI
jgi:Spy/CpxP family protein refolding chaperone